MSTARPYPSKRWWWPSLPEKFCEDDNLISDSKASQFNPSIQPCFLNLWSFIVRTDIEKLFPHNSILAPAELPESVVIYCQK